MEHFIVGTIAKGDMVKAQRSLHWARQSLRLLWVMNLLRLGNSIDTVIDHADVLKDHAHFPHHPA